MKIRNYVLGALCGFVLLILVACTSPATETPSPTLTQAASPTAMAISMAEPQTIVLGDISDDPGEVIEGSQPLADYLAEQLQGFGMVEGQVRVAADADEMVALLKAGDVDLYFDSVYPATLISDASGAQPILRRWRFGVEAYYTVIFASVASGVKTLEDLPGHMVALDNQFSTSGYLLPVVSMKEAGLNLVGKASYDESLAEDEVGFVFSYDDENTLQWVLSGLVAAGATDDYHYEVVFPDTAKENLVVLAKTESVPRQVVVARPNMEPALLDAIRQALMNAHESEAGQAALEPFQTTRFDEFPEGIEGAQNRMRDMMQHIQDIPLP